MNKPVFRLELLQYVLGLDCRFNIDVLRSALALCLEHAAHCAAPADAAVAKQPVDSVAPAREDEAGMLDGAC
jgi:hypothetical protein